MVFDWLSVGIGFLTGGFTGAAAVYLGDKYTDRRREKELCKTVKTDFMKIKEKMPKLLNEMKTELQKNQFMREFMVLQNDQILFVDSQRTIYPLEKVDSKIQILENLNFVSNVTSGNTPKYRLTEEFVELINKYG